MNINLDDISNLVYRETLKVIKETLDSQMDDSDEERQRQRNQAKVIQKRDLNASDSEDDDIQKEEEEDIAEEEKEPSTGVPSPDDEDPTAAAPREDRTGGKGTADSPKLDTPTAKQINKVTVGSVIDKLNALRGGKSLKDPEVRKSFNQYFNALDGAQRKTLLIFLTGVAQILAGVAQGDEAPEPHDAGIETDAKQAQPKKKVAKKSKSPQGEARPGSETNPIVVGEARRHSRASIKSVIKAYKRNK